MSIVISKVRTRIEVRTRIVVILSIGIGLKCT